MYLSCSETPTMEAKFFFTKDDMTVNRHLGYPQAYAKLCRNRTATPYSLGPPLAFTPYTLKQDELLKADELEMMFPVIDPKARPTAKANIFISLLWKQLNHLGNAGFDPAVIRVDPYGNVLYFHADSASPLAWDIDHWFPCSRGGLNVPSNLRILQWQACKRKQNQLEFHIPWWDFHSGISVNQFLSIFAASNSDFRQRAFSFLFSEEENEEIKPSQSINDHSFPHHFVKSTSKFGLTPAAIVVTRRESSSLLSQSMKVRPLKENENPNQGTSTYQEIAMARDSLKHKEETKKLQTELQELDHEVTQMKRKNEEDTLNIQDLELALIKRRRRAEKCRRLAEAQSSYRTMLQKMIRDAMHQSVVYKEQARLNQAAANALMARLEAQKAICDASEKELHKIHIQKDNIEKEIHPVREKARKRSRENYDLLIKDRDTRKPVVLCLPEIKSGSQLHKERRIFPEAEEQRGPLTHFSPFNGQKFEGKFEINAVEDTEDAPEMCETSRRCRPIPRKPKTEDGETRKLRGKENVENWLEMLLKNTSDEPTSPEGEDQSKSTATDDIIRSLNIKYPMKGKFKEEVLGKEFQVNKDEIVIIESRDLADSDTLSRRKSEGKEKRGKGGKEKVLPRSESARTLRQIKSSPSFHNTWA